MDQQFKLTAGCFSRDVARSKLSALRYGIDPLRAYTRLDELLADESDQLDAIVVLTPQDQHFSHVQACLNAGVPVICEKALVTTASEAVQIRDQLQRSSGYLAVTYNYTGYPMVRELRSMVQAGILGRIVQVQIEMPQEGFSRLSQDGSRILPQSWRLRDGFVPTLSLDLGSHVHMMVKFLTGSTPEKLVAISSTRGNFPEVIDNVCCITRYSDGLDCMLWYGKTALGCRNGLRVRLFGEQGSAEWIQESPEHLHVSDRTGGRFVLDRTSNSVRIANLSRYQRFKAGHPAGFIEAFANYYFDLALDLRRRRGDVSRTRSEYSFGVEESIEGLRMLEAIARSSANNCWEDI